MKKEKKKQHNVENLKLPHRFSNSYNTHISDEKRTSFAHTASTNTTPPTEPESSFIYHQVYVYITQTTCIEYR